MMSNRLLRQSRFSYVCSGCGRCCHHKRIQIGAFELFRLSRNRGLSTTEFGRRYLASDGPYLRFEEDGACPFLVAGSCIVHADRPLVCRLYPLGRHVDPQGEENFSCLMPHPDSEGRYGDAGTVADYVEQQGALDYLAAADRYQELFHRLHAALQKSLPVQSQFRDSTMGTVPLKGEDAPQAFMDWIDIDLALEKHFAPGTAPVPHNADQAVELHLMVIGLELNISKEDEHE